jgi:hypothetical protein
VKIVTPKLYAQLRVSFFHRVITRNFANKTYIARNKLQQRVIKNKFLNGAMTRNYATFF